MLVRLSAQCLCIRACAQTVSSICAFVFWGFFLIFFFTSLGMFGLVCARELDARSYYPMFPKQTNSLELNAEHSSAPENVGSWNGYRRISGFWRAAAERQSLKMITIEAPLPPIPMETSANEDCGGKRHTDYL